VIFRWPHFLEAETEIPPNPFRPFNAEIGVFISAK